MNARVTNSPDTSTASAGADDYALMEGVRHGDSEALSALYDRYSPMLYGLCLRALRDAGEAEDLVIDVFWEVWERSDRYDPARSSPASYLSGLTRSRALDRLRSKKARRRVNAEPASDNLDAAMDARKESAGPAESALLAERRAHIEAAMSTLSAPQRQALEMAFFDCLSHSEVAEALGEPIGTIKSRIRQALSQLRKGLGIEP